MEPLLRGDYTGGKMEPLLRGDFTTSRRSTTRPHRRTQRHWRGTSPGTNDHSDWAEWYQEGFPPQTQAEEDGMGPEEIKEFCASLNQDEAQASPLTPALQQDVLSSRHLPPTTLPSSGTRVSGNLSSDSSTHLRSAKASRTDRDTDLRAELQEVIQQNRALEEHQAALLRGAAPTSPQPMSHGLPNSGLMSPLTIHQPSPRYLPGMQEALGRRQGTEFNNNNNSNITREQLFHQEFRVANPHLNLFQGELVPECLAFPHFSHRNGPSGRGCCANSYGITY